MHKLNGSYEKRHRDLAMMLLESGVVRNPESKHVPGDILQPYELDVRAPDHPRKPGLLTVDIVQSAAWCMEAKLTACCRDARKCTMGAVPWAGAPFARGLAGRLGIIQPVCLDKRCNEGFTTYCPVIPEGVTIAAGGMMCLVDAVVTKGDTLVESLAILRDAGAEIRHAITLIGCDEVCGRLESWDCKLYSVFTPTEIFQIYRDEKVISPMLYYRIRQYIEHRRHLSLQ
jgi:hypothetical protein